MTPGMFLAGALTLWRQVQLPHSMLAVVVVVATAAAASPRGQLQT